MYSSPSAKDALKLSTMVGENFEIYSSPIAKNALKMSTMVGENFKIYSSPMAGNILTCLPNLAGRTNPCLPNTNSCLPFGRLAGVNRNPELVCQLAF